MTEEELTEEELTEEELVAMEETIPAQAVAALTKAGQRARESGLPIVLIIDNQLVRIDSEGTTVLKDMPPPFKVTVRTKRATT